MASVLLQPLSESDAMLHEEAPHPAGEGRHVAQLQEDCDERHRSLVSHARLFPRVSPEASKAKAAPAPRRTWPLAELAAWTKAERGSALSLEAQAAEVLLRQLGSPSPDAEAF